MVATDIGRRERKRLQTREALVEAAFRLFRERGFDATTVEDITEAADVSPRTFFRHFAAKEDVVFADTEARLGELAEALALRPTDEPILTSVREGLLDLVHVFEEEREALIVQAEIASGHPALEQRADHARSMLGEVVTGYVAARLDVDADDDLRPMLVAGAVVTAVIAAVKTWMARGAADDLGERVRQSLSLLDRGFGLPG